MVKKTTYFFLNIILLCITAFKFVNAQTITLTIVSKNNDKIFLQENINYKTSFSSTKNALDYIHQLPAQLHAKGFISAALDSFTFNKQTVTAYLFIGEKYVWSKLSIDSITLNYLSLINTDKKIFEEQPFNPVNVAIVQENLLNYFANNGYPFATIKFDSLKIEEKKVSATLKIEPGFLYLMDSIRLLGNAKLSKNFLFQYLDITPKSFYNETKLQDIERKLKQLPYIQQRQPWQITMLGTGFLIDIFADVKKTNQADALIGFLPNNQQTGGSLLFTADVKLNLQNAFATGETIIGNWQQLQPKSPRINLQFQRPYIFNSKFGLDFSFDLFKKDSSFLNLQSSIGLQYNTGNYQKTKIFFQKAFSNLLDIDTNRIKLTKKLPDVVDVDFNNLIIEHFYNNTNYKYNPQKGNEWFISLSAGTKKLRKNNTVTQIRDASFNYNNLYDTVKMNTYQLKVKSIFVHYFSLKKYSVLKTGLQVGWLQSSTIYKNEMFQIGGFKTLRGFDEESIYANQFGISTLEYRYLFNSNSYFNIFSDFGFANNKLLSVNHNYIGFGAGLSFETKQGILNISLAAGKRNDLDFNVRQSKIHIGFVSVF